MKLRITMLILGAITILIAGGCSTATSFKLPPNTKVRVNYKPQTHCNGLAKIRPFFWNTFNGVPYELIETNDDKIVKRGRLPTTFRIVSIFWPPYAFIYWPLGFACDCYDLTKEVPECCYKHHADLSERTE